MGFINDMTAERDMKRHIAIACAIGAVLLAGHVPGRFITAKEPKPDAKKPPAGLRVMFNGNSWFNFVPWGVADLVKAAEIQGHKEVKATKPNDFSLIESGEVDVYANGVHWWTEPINEAEKVLTPGLKANPKFRVYYHAAWLVGDGRAKEIKTKADYDDSKLADSYARPRRTFTTRSLQCAIEQLRAWMVEFAHENAA